MSDRIEKLNSEFRKNITEIINKKVKNPNITEMFTITEVTCDTELTFAKVYVSIYSTSSEASKRTFEGLQSSAGFIRNCLLKTMRIRAVPQLFFELDHSYEHSNKINELLAEIKEEPLQQDVLDNGENNGDKK
ncbi:MAG: 30S ribosome-binding factor RbfA [Clostridia bacterium]